ncbi:MAG: GNAT family N-acetyltransferase [Anaerolineales bacterium]|nr:GNAT family N-acetyltransferase [Anaerolineales bacterium]
MPAPKPLAPPAAEPSLELRLVTPERWRDIETLFGPRGACAGCWCMWWRLSRADFDANQGDANRRAFKRLVSAGTVPGLMAYSDGQPAGWCCIGPRTEFPALDRSRVLARIDDQPVWSIVCFYIGRRHRHQGLSSRLAQAAVDYARACGASIVEAYPIDTASPAYPDAYAYTGLVPTFTRIGFAEVVRRSASRPIMRYLIEQPERGEGAMNG